jgi:predicted Na+-dependent transporter
MAGRTVGLAVGRAVVRSVGIGDPVGVGVGLGIGVALAVELALGLGLGHAAVESARPATGCTAIEYGMRSKAAGTWLVVKAFSAIPGYA